MPKNKLMRLGIFISASISLCAMLAGGEFVTMSLSGIPLLGLVMAVLGAVVVVLGIEKIKLVNTLLVPMIVVCIALIFFKLPICSNFAITSIARPIMYSGLDVLLGGVIISEEGKELSFKETLLSCTFICVILFCMLFMLQTIVLTDTIGTSMPVLTISELFGLKAVCGVLIAAAIFTTLVSSLKIVSDTMREMFRKTKKLTVLGKSENKSIVVFGCLTAVYPLSFFGFENIVNSLYPIISICGVILTILVITKLTIHAINSKMKRKRVRSLKEYRHKHTTPRYCGSDTRIHCRNHRRNPRHHTRVRADECLQNNPQKATCDCPRPPHPNL